MLKASVADIVWLVILLTAARVEEGIGVAVNQKNVCPYLGAVTLLGRNLALNRVTPFDM